MLFTRCIALLFFSLTICFSCQSPTDTATTPTMEDQQASPSKKVVYQVFTRLFGNTNTTNKPWGTMAENGVGKFNDFTDKALSEIKALGVTHIWYTGVPHHAVINDYSAYGISSDDPDVVKGRAGSPYAVKDYYNVNPDLAEDPGMRMEEFEAFISRTHAQGLKVIIDIVPNHVARGYQSISKPEGVEDFGATDDTTVEYHRNNNFYYIPGASFQVPIAEGDYKPLGGDKHPLADGKFVEVPAKWTGNGSRKAQPHANDWYETVKVNYGVQPNGEHDFPALPEGFDQKDYESHYTFWQQLTVPDSWIKFRDIALYWIEKGVDGFRYDMAEMVPVEFWSYMNSAIKMANPDAFLLAEIYNPSIYRDYIHLGKMDYLYDKVDLYDTLKHIMQGHGSTDDLQAIQERYADIDGHLLHFLENHDEHRIASPAFAGDARKAFPAMVVSSTMGAGPTMIYFGQEVGEPGAEEPGFGDPERTSIFDYIGVPHHQRWMNDGAFDGGQLSTGEQILRDFYQRLLNFTLESPALMGAYLDLHTFNRANTEGYTNKVYSFARYQDTDQLIVLTNFSDQESYSFNLELPAQLLSEWGLEEGQHRAEDQLYQQRSATIVVNDGKGLMPVRLGPLETLILRVSNTDR